MISRGNGGIARWAMSVIDYIDHRLTQLELEIFETEEELRELAADETVSDVWWAWQWIDLTRLRDWANAIRLEYER